MIASDQEVRATESWGPEALNEVREARRRHQQATAGERNKWIQANRYFYERMKRILQFIVEPHKRVLDIRCETGHLLAAVKPAYGVGVEISDAMVACASRENPELYFVKSDPENLELHETFDYILFQHIFDTADILRAFESIRRHCTAETQIVIINYNHLWEPFLELASKVGLRAQFIEPNWVSENDVRGFLKLAGFRPVRKHRLILFPKWLPGISALMNGFLARLPGLRRLCLMQVMVARPVVEPKREDDVTVSVIVPCRNEVGNVRHAVERIPAMGKVTEILFCDDKSTDGTPDEVRRLQELYPEKNIRLVDGPGICKAENVWTGFRAARGDVLMILDADLTVMPEELPTFLRALVWSRGDFVNGSRLVYPMQENAMKVANMLGNKVFGLVFSFLLDQRIKDTLCGTKVLWRRDWLRMEPNLGSWGIQDMWGDYELLFGASKLHLEIVEVPVHYQERIHGVTKMTRVFSNGLRMLRICWHAWYRLEG
ncbi:MAG TPA: glycosyltransferase [Candidatus Dormibacteraeota bacterium]|nr:glycosyltransferase [Candidatus Dormibacteraeota bacterium]